MVVGSAVWGLLACYALAGGSNQNSGKDQGSGKEQKSKHSSDLPTVGFVDVIIQFKNPPSDADEKDLNNNGAELKRKFKHFRGGHYRVRAEAISALEQNLNILYITPDRKLSGTLDRRAAA